MRCQTFFVGMIPTKIALVGAVSSVVASAFGAAPPQAAQQATVRVICRIRAGHEQTVRVTVKALGLGGESIRTDVPGIQSDALTATLVGVQAIDVDSPTDWPHIDGEMAEAGQLAKYIVVEARETTPLQTLLAQLLLHPDIFESVEADSPGTVLGTTIPNDPLFSLQYGLNNTGAPVAGLPGITSADISALDAWELSGAAPMIIAIVDTGVSQSHPDLILKLVPGRNFSGPDATATDDSSIIPHGTRCAGIAGAAANNGIGISGVSWNARIMPVRVADQWGNSSESMCASGIIWAVDHGARIISVSLGFTAGTEYLRAAVEYAAGAGAVIVAAAGNSPGVPVYFPARLPGVLAVSATNNQDVIGPFCTSGPEVDVCAPGVWIMTTTDSAANPNGYSYETGTSMAVPFVSGIAALLLETAPWLSALEVRRIIRDTADDRGPVGWDPRYGFGRVNAARALESIAGNDQVCVADWNGDGAVTSADLFAYFTSFFAGQGDVTGDGQTNSLDLFEFLNRYYAGC